MKIAKMLAKLAVLAVALWLVPNASAQSAPPKQKPPANPKALPLVKGQQPAAAALVPASPKAPKSNNAKLAVIKPAVAKPKPVNAKAAVAKPAVAKPIPAASEAGPSVANAAPPLEKVEPVLSRRDPFEPLVSAVQANAPGHLPPGKAGLVISTVRVDGTVKSANGMIAVVSNPDERVYFIHEGDRLYDGDVQRISLEGVTFKENSKDAFGKAVERLVTKRIYASAGEQQ